jgi:hypothetical protein
VIYSLKSIINIRIFALANIIIIGLLAASWSAFYVIVIERIDCPIEIPSEIRIIVFSSLRFLAKRIFIIYISFRALLG